MELSLLWGMRVPAETLLMRHTCSCLPLILEGYERKTMIEWENTWTDCVPCHSALTIDELIYSKVCATPA